MPQSTAETPTGEALLQWLRELLPELREKYHVVGLAVFGSRSRADAVPESDLDLLVDFGEEASLFDLVGMELELEEAFGIKVDIVTRASIKPRLRHRILESAIPVGRGMTH